MPIYGLTRTQGILPKLGELRKGTEKIKITKGRNKGKMRAGMDQDYFRFTAVDET